MGIYGKIFLSYFSLFWEGAIMNRLFLREKDPIITKEYLFRRKIGIIGLGPGCGVTSIGTTLAKIVSKNNMNRIQYLEITNPKKSKPLIFDGLGMDKRFLNREFIDFYKEVKEGNPIGHLINRDEDIGWVLITKEDIQKKIILSTQEKTHLINNLNFDLLFCDLELGNQSLGKLEDDRELLSEMSHLIVIIDPLPSKLLASYNLLQWIKVLEEKGLPVSYIVNKYNKGVHKRDFLDFIKLRPNLFIPFISPDEFYVCEYNCQLPFRISELRENLSVFSQNIDILK